LRGYVDHVSNSRIAGWAFNDANPNEPTLIRASLGATTIAEGIANISRPDVSAAVRAKGHFGFSFSNPELASLRPSDLAKLKILAKREDKWIPIPRSTGQGREPQYQSFSDAPGASKSNEKLSALRLHILENRSRGALPLAGLTVLDIGCNEGFFCNEATKLGATKVVGLDSNREFIQRAQKRFPHIQFINDSWWNIPDAQFDLIFFLSAIHYEPKQRLLLQKLAGHLTTTGTLILECGLGPIHGKAWYSVQRADGIRKYPSFEMFQQELLKPFTVRHVGASIPQLGDPVPRQVFHCRLKQSTALLIVGETNTGKSTLAFSFSESGVPSFHTDVLLSRIAQDERYAWSPVATIVRKMSNASAINFGEIGTTIVKEKLADKLVDLIMLEAPTEADLFCIEGQLLFHAEVLNSLKSRLKTNGIRTWTVTPT